MKEKTEALSIQIPLPMPAWSWRALVASRPLSHAFQGLKPLSLLTQSTVPGPVPNMQHLNPFPEHFTTNLSLLKESSCPSPGTRLQLTLPASWVWTFHRH